MDILSTILLIFIFALFALSIKMSLDSDDKDIPRLINVLKNEDIFLFPIGIALIGYQLYKSGHLEPDNYIVLMFYANNILMILLYKVFGDKIDSQTKYLAYLCFNIVLTPFFTIGCFVIMLFRIL